MAILNDNLFTNLIQSARKDDFGGRMRTQWGYIRSEFTEKGLTKLYFEENLPRNARVNPAFKATFLKWLASFQTLSTEEQWQYLDPEGTTEFRKEVWTGLLGIPLGETISYGELAEKIGQPGKARGVGQAMANNRIPLLIPCHRVIHADGKTQKYRWGSKLKSHLITLERVPCSDLLSLFQ